jgi:branched-subunit amino acid transport protein AzlD
MTHGLGLILAIALMAVATALTRFLPFLVFGRGRKPPAVIGYLGRALPPAMLALLVVYCLRAVDLTSPPFGLAEVIACAVVAALHLWKGNALISIFSGTAVYMALVQLVFA